MTKSQYWQQVADWHYGANRHHLHKLAANLAAEPSQYNLWDYQEAEGMGSEVAALRFNLFGPANKAD